MKDKAILITSFGTSHEETRQKNIVQFENFIGEKCSDYTIYSAYTSSMVRGILKKRGIEVDSVAMALDRMYQEGIKNVVIQPTHLIYGHEFEKIAHTLRAFEGKFERIEISTPLLAETDDMIAVVQILSNAIDVDSETALVLMGHGTDHYVNAVYPALDYVAKASGNKHVFVGTVEGYPEVEAVVDFVRKRGYKKAVLTPLMFVAGDHAVNDMASNEPDSWKSIFSQNGLEVTCVVKGLGEYPEIQTLYYKHLCNFL
ncbi:sirohydrochlorin cobaltochelatase [Fusibacter ferrireducens]|uniref:Sirohydrochlorin cobaltochelatase n=1 Tax=Fusibacter ferrireducens TaxID=2785058 RepID=A0ABR9ZMV6_9FIRM|nr:sirohydrochlorin cobaltochelatase [Fusibacter ferrireducens]MBF4691790.1 sirohydrochlorin cobaltochelatase [Fusibacter ferrireducens]